MNVVTDVNKLKSISKDISSEQIKKHYELLKSFVAERRGKLQGCSCVQYGYPLRAFTMRHPKTKEFSYVFNPKVIWKLGIRFSLEGCLSVKGRYIVTRPLVIKAEWFDENNNLHTKILGPKRARIFMHEMDHLNGLTIKMRGFGGIL